MALTPIDVQQKTFGTALRGYDLDEVDDFLDDVVTSLKSYEERLVESQERIAALQAELEGKGDSESAISRALVTAQRSADALVAGAQSEAAQVKEAAQSEADEVLAGARAERERLDTLRATEQSKLDAEISAMRDRVAAIRTKVLDLNAAIGADLDEMDATLGDPAPSTDDDVLFETPADANGSDWSVTDETTTDEESLGDEAPVVVVDTPVEESPASTTAWYETSDTGGDQALDLGLATDDEAAASEWAAPDDTDDTDSGSDGAGQDADPLDEAIAEATFQGDGPEEADDNGWAPSDDDAAEETSEGWEEAWGSEDGDRPRRPWE